MHLTTLLTLAALTTAQTTTLTLPYIETGAPSFESVGASIISANPTATTLALHCLTPECGLFYGHTLISGPSTWNVAFSLEPGEDFTMTRDCAVPAATTSTGGSGSGPVCKESATGAEAMSPGSSTKTYGPTDLGSLVVTVTAGAEKLGATGSATQSASASVSVTPAPGSSAQMSGSGSGPVSSSAPATTSSTGAAAGNKMLGGGGLVGVAAGVFGGLLL